MILADEQPVRAITGIQVGVAVDLGLPRRRDRDCTSDGSSGVTDSGFFAACPTAPPKADLFWQDWSAASNSRALIGLAVLGGVNRQAIGTPDPHGKGTPYRRRDRRVPVANRRVPRASHSALTSDGAARVGGARLPTGASRGGTQARCLKRQLSLPVSMNWQ
jgi:hypothetical protein